MENLRRLVQKYRLELSNREGNFNRMFTEKTPVLVERQKTLGTLMTKSRGRLDKSLPCDFSHAMESYDSDRFPKVAIFSITVCIAWIWDCC